MNVNIKAVGLLVKTPPPCQKCCVRWHSLPSDYKMHGVVDMTRHGADSVEKDFSPHSSYFEPLLCEYEQVWETRAAMTDKTGGDPIVVHRSYSCVLFFCPYPDKKCKVRNP